MSLFVDRDTFMHYLNTADVNWEATARECIAKGFELGDENKKLKEKNKQLKQTLQKVKSIAKGVRSYLEIPAPRDVRFEMDRILDLIAKAQESEVFHE